jgi:hypothetical protein
VVDDDKRVQQAFPALLRANGRDVHAFNSGRAFSGHTASRRRCTVHLNGVRINSLHRKAEGSLLTLSFPTVKQALGEAATATGEPNIRLNLVRGTSVGFVAIKRLSSGQ